MSAGVPRHHPAQVLLDVASDVDEARHQLDTRGVAAVEQAQALLEAASRRLRPLVTDRQLSPAVARRVARSGATLSSHLLAAHDVAAAGASARTVARVLRRAAQPEELYRLAGGVRQPG